MKIDRTEKFNLERLTNDFYSGTLESAVARPDSNDAHKPHVDLTVRPVGQETIKYRIFDTVGTSNLYLDYGANGKTFRR